MYSEQFQKDKEKIRDLLSKPNELNFKLLISKLKMHEVLTLEEAVSLIMHCTTNSECKQELMDTVRKRRHEAYKNQVNLIVPHYQSSKCEDSCAYCGFRKKNNDMVRTSLSDEDFEKEINLLIDWGYTSYEFVYATDSEYTPEKIGQRIQKAKEIGKKRGKNLFIGVDSQSFEKDEYDVLREHGMDFLVLWMETYGEIYKKVHPKNTKKGDFEKRLNTCDRLIKSGVSRYSLGVLLGLSPWIEDIACLIAHGIYLRNKYGYSPFIIGIPKMTNAMGLNNNAWKHIPSDEELVLISHIYKAIFPDAMLFVNSRQSFDINLEIIQGGGDLYTVDFTTFPGAYLNNGLLGDSVEQFKTLDYSREEAIQMLRDVDVHAEFNWPYQKSQSVRETSMI